MENDDGDPNTGTGWLFLVLVLGAVLLASPLLLTIFGK